MNNLSCIDGKKIELLLSHCEFRICTKSSLFYTIDAQWHPQKEQHGGEIVERDLSKEKTLTRKYKRKANVKTTSQ